MKYRRKKRLEFIFHLAVWILTFAFISWLGFFIYQHVERGEFPGWGYALFAAYALVIAAVEHLIARNDPALATQNVREFLQ